MARLAGTRFTSGYVSNEATLSTLQKILPGLITFSDELNHASMIAGIRAGRGAYKVFRHNDAAHLRQLRAAPAPAHPRRPACPHGCAARPDVRLRMNGASR